MAVVAVLALVAGLSVLRLEAQLSPGAVRAVAGRATSPATGSEEP